MSSVETESRHNKGATSRRCDDPDCDWQHNADTIPSNQFHDLTKEEREHIKIYHPHSYPYILLYIC